MTDTGHVVLTLKRPLDEKWKLDGLIVIYRDRYEGHETEYQTDIRRRDIMVNVDMFYCGDTTDNGKHGGPFIMVPGNRLYNLRWWIRQIWNVKKQRKNRSKLVV